MTDLLDTNPNIPDRRTPSHLVIEPAPLQVTWQLERPPTGTFAAIGGFMGFYVMLRRLFGRLAAERPATVDLISLFLAFTAAQAIGVILLVRLFPGGAT